MNTPGSHEEYAVTADLYDYVVPYRTRADINFFVEAARASGGPVLEVGCGTGRVLIPTARGGTDIVGLDLSPHMLQVCRERLKNEPEAVRSKTWLVQADMRHFDLEGPSNSSPCHSGHSSISQLSMTNFPVCIRFTGIWSRGDD